MRRRSEGEEERPSSPADSLEAGLSRFLQRNPRFFLYVGIGFGILVLVALAMVAFSGGSR